MFAVIFEVNPKPEQWEAYLGYAKLLRPELEQIDGFIDNERFSSLRREGWLLSLSIWRDEKAVIRWRTRARHHEVQQKGRTEVFGDYHLRVGEIIADNRLPAGQVLREQRFDETAAAAKLIALSEAAPEGLPDKPDAGNLAARLGDCSTRPIPDLSTGMFSKASSSPENSFSLRHGADGAAAKARRKAARIFATAASG